MIQVESEKEESNQTQVPEANKQSYNRTKRELLHPAGSWDILCVFYSYEQFDKLALGGLVLELPTPAADKQRLSSLVTLLPRSHEGLFSGSSSTRAARPMTLLCTAVAHHRDILALVCCAVMAVDLQWETPSNDGHACSRLPREQKSPNVHACGCYESI